MSISKTRYKEIQDTVNQVLIEQNITEYPIDMIRVFSNYNNCKLVSFSEFKKKENMTLDEVFSHMETEEGCTFANKKHKSYIIYYNDFEKTEEIGSRYKTPSRRLWTLAHELGHIFLLHFRKVDKPRLSRSNLSNSKYEELECEANQFAAVLLSHPVILDKLNVRSPEDIMQICNLSKEASINRYNALERWRDYHMSYIEDSAIYTQFQNFINENKLYCTYCGCNQFETTNNINFCPVCGHNQFKIGNDTKLFNSCTKCGLSSHDNARFCEYCGAPTTFFKRGFINDWETDKPFEEIQKENEK